jgi:hypothetical protein
MSNLGKYKVYLCVCGRGIQFRPLDEEDSHCDYCGVDMSTLPFTIEDRTVMLRELNERRRLTVKCGESTFIIQSKTKH